MSATPRLFVNAHLAEGANVGIDADQTHYLARVLRLGPGDSVRLFNGRDGEFDATIAEVNKRVAQVTAGARTREQTSPPDLWLLFAPLKKARTDFVVEKATELGVRRLLPVLTNRTGAETVRVDRLARIAQEASEQTERLDLPLVAEAAPLAAVLASWDTQRILWFCDESGNDAGHPWGGEEGRAPAAARAFAANAAAGPAAILAGPEGGFTPTERSMLRGCAFVRPIGLGPRILRAETAVVAALALWQGVAGDWR